MEPITALYTALAVTGGVGAGLLGKSMHNSGRLKYVEEKVNNISKLDEVKRLVDSELRKKS